MQTMGDEARKTHCSHKELQCKQWVMKQGRLIVHTRSYNCKKWEMKQGRLIVHTRYNNANNGQSSKKDSMSYNANNGS
ncbi:hypothetical protein KSS87_012321 [Heliosperma pusillum]|nr:hypothetical protein KSS87_012321 [Heliosperma pusillum]